MAKCLHRTVRSAFDQLNNRNPERSCDTTQIAESHVLLAVFHSADGRLLKPRGVTQRPLAQLLRTTHFTYACHPFLSSACMRYLHEWHGICFSVICSASQRPIAINAGAMSEPVQHYGARIRGFRQSLNLTQGELGKLAGIDQAHLSRLETGVSEGSPMQIAEIARVLGVTMSDLFADQVKEPSPSDLYAPQNVAQQIRCNYSAPEGLRKLASDLNLQEVLAITDDEFQLLASINLPTQVSMHGYVQLLMTIRAIT